jgi:hypothetical protein
MEQVRSSHRFPNLRLSYENESSSAISHPYPGIVVCFRVRPVWHNRSRQFQQQLGMGEAAQSATRGFLHNKQSLQAAENKLFATQFVAISPPSKYARPSVVLYPPSRIIESLFPLIFRVSTPET